jgi:pimeloyl-ACP methyl ester carboxylesterase
MDAREPKCEDAVVFLPGLMGSSLVDANKKLVWGFKPGLLAEIIARGKPLDRLRLPADGSPDGIEASRVLGTGAMGMLPNLFGIFPYTKLLNALRRDIALDPAAVMDAPYDWRRSIADAARSLQPRMEAHLERWRKHAKGSREAKLTLVGHSMGGLVARYYVEVLGCDSEVSRVLTLGTPHYGSLKALLALYDGRVYKPGVHHTHVRDLVRTLPSVYELTPRYRCVGAKGATARKLEPTDIETLGGSRRLARAAAVIHDQLQHSADQPVKTKYHVLRGVSQPTLQGVTLDGASARFHRELEGVAHKGDGTVYRAAAVHRGDTPSPLSQTHGQLASSDDAIAFVKDMLLGTSAATLGESELGFIAPDVASAGSEFQIELCSERPADVDCRGYDLEHGTLVFEHHVVIRDAPVAVKMNVPLPGLYRIEASAGGSEPVNDTLLVV